MHRRQETLRKHRHTTLACSPFLPRELLGTLDLLVATALDLVRLFHRLQHDHKLTL